MRIAIILSTMMFIAACGHMAPYSEHRGKNIEIYNVAGSYFLRVPYRVMVYDVIPHTYLDEEWIALGPSINEHKLLYCSPLKRDKYQEPIPINGVVELKGNEVNINLSLPTGVGGRNRAQPYKFNGVWSLIEVEGPIPASPSHRQYGCE